MCLDRAGLRCQSDARPPDAARHLREERCVGSLVSYLPGLGVVLIAAAVLLPTSLSSQIVKFPLNETTTATLAGPG